MYYLKNSVPYATYADPITKVKIGRGQILAVETLTDNMRKRIRSKGLLECTLEEYKAFNAGSAKTGPAIESEIKGSEEVKAAAPEEAPSEAKVDEASPSPRQRKQKRLNKE